MPLLTPPSVEKFPAQKRKRSPSGRNIGQRCDRSSSVSNPSVRTDAPVPSALTRHNGPPARCEYTITLLALQLAPLAVNVTGTTSCTGPPPASTFMILASAKKPMYCESGDQNG